jgi:hypothetical protein
MYFITVAFLFCVLTLRARIVTGCGLDNQGFGVRFLVGTRTFISPCSTDSGVHPTYPVGIVGSFPGVKRPELEVDHSPTSAEVKKMRVYTSTSPYVFMG